MKIAIATVQIPFVRGGAEVLTEELQKELEKRGHKATIVSIPFKWDTPKALTDSMLMGRLTDLSSFGGDPVDLVICMKFPMYYLRHPNKVLWLMHQHRMAYDLWGTEYGDIEFWEEGEEIRQMIRENDERYLPECRGLYTIAQTTSDRLKAYNGLDSTVLYHPPRDHEKLHNEGYGDYVFYPSRINSIKRQRLLVEAAKYLKTPAKIVLAGGAAESELEVIRGIIAENHLEERVRLAGFISDEEKVAYYAGCLAVYFGAYNEDYGYITLEGFFSEKPVIVHRDAGEPTFFVKDGENGFVTDPDPKQIAEKIDLLYEDRALAERMGKAGRQSLLEKNMDWDHVIARLLGEGNA